jgi:HD superfamily phosphohydrolase YqeK
MTKDDLIFFKKWFFDYVKSFYSSNEEDQKNILLKKEHTFNVCENIVRIARELALSNKEVMLAEVIALFHDIGRFPQYAKYKTFRDRNSVNHGNLGAQTLIKEKILQNLHDTEQELIIKSVRFHNTFSIPRIEKEDVIFFIKLIKDADKLDIWRVFLEYYKTPDKERASAVGLGLPDTTDYSEEILSRIQRGQMASLSQLKTLNDFKLMQLSWVYDLHFRPSFQFLSERDYIGKFLYYLPQEEAIKKVSAVLKEFVQERLKD